MLTSDSQQISKEKEKLEQTIKGIDKQLDITIKSISVNEVNHMLKKIDEKRYKGISSVLEEELTEIKDRKKSLIQEIDDSVKEINKSNVNELIQTLE